MKDIVIKNLCLGTFTKFICKKKIIKYHYFSQWESPQLVDKILQRSISAIDDPNWKNSGAIDKNEYLNWS